MRTIYATPTKELRSTKSQVVRNPRYFNKPRPDPGEVVVVGNHPRIVKAYQDAGAKVTQVANVADLNKKAAG